MLVLLGLRAALPWVVELLLERVLSGVLAARVDIGDVDLDLREAEVALRDPVLRALPD